MSRPIATKENLTAMRRDLCRALGTFAERHGFPLKGSAVDPMELLYLALGVLSGLNAALNRDDCNYEEILGALVRENKKGNP